MADFELLEELGRGALNIVYRARRDGQDYAVKVQRDRSGNDSTQQAFRREAAVLSHLRHPGLVEIHAVGETDGRPYLVMELLEGRTLAATLAGAAEPFDERHLVQLAQDCAGALAAAHRSGLVHRDIKPDNLVIGSDGHAKLIDFGLVTQTGTQQHRDAAVGTIRYSPPEQTGMLKRPVDGRSDLYSLGVVLFEAAAGAAPFNADDVGELVRLHAVAAPPDLRALRPDLSPTFVAIVERLLAKDPDDRYQTGEGLLADLNQLAAHQGPAPASFPVGLHDDPASVIYDLPLVGRKEELSELQDRWHDAARGRGSVALVAGKPGGGKTRLVRELLLNVSEDDALVIAGKIVRNNPVPLAALREAIDGHLRRIATLQAGPRHSAEKRVRRAAAAAGAMATTFSPALAALVGETGTLENTGERQEQYLAAVAAFFIALANEHGCAVLGLDDVQWLDAATLRVLELIAVDLPTTPLLLVATTRDDPASADAVLRFTESLCGTLRCTIALRPLDEAATGLLVSEQLGGIVGDDDFIRLIHSRSGGNPFAAVEYVRAVLHAGLISPFWGVFVVDRIGLDRLALPDDVMELVLSRVDQLGDDARLLLAAGAAMGTRFRPSFLGFVMQVDERRVNDAISDALRERLIEHADGNECAYVHDRIREALLDPLDDAELRALHQRIAEALDATGGDGDDHTFATARHYALGETERTPDKLFQWSERAGRAALAGYSAGEAARFFQRAADAAAQCGYLLDAGFYETWGQIHLGTGDLVSVQRAFDKALELSTDPLQQARIHLQLARSASGIFDTQQALVHAKAGLAATGEKLPTAGLGLIGVALKGIAVALFMFVTKRGVGAASSGPERELLCLKLRLHQSAEQSHYLQLEPLPMLAILMRVVPISLRVGRSPEMAHMLVNLAVFFASSGMPKTAERFTRRGIEIAEATGDPQAIAHAYMYTFLALEAGGDTREAGAVGAKYLQEYGRWLEIGDLLLFVGAVSYNLDMRGYSREALEQWASAHERARNLSTPGAQENPYLYMGVLAMQALGSKADAAAMMESCAAFGQAAENNRFRRQTYLGTLMRYTVEQGELGPEIDELIQWSDELELNPMTASVWLQPNFMQPAFVLMERARRTEGAERAAAMKEMRKRVRQTKLMRLSPMMQGYVDLTSAGLAQLKGQNRRALRLARKAERLAIKTDMPVIHYGVARCRAYVYAALGEPAEHRRQAHLAMRLCAEHGWVPRAAVLRNEFGAAAGRAFKIGDSIGSDASQMSRTGAAGASRHGNAGSSTHTGNSGRGGTAAAGLSGTHTGGSIQGKRSLDALLALSVAASHTQDQHELSCVALDQLVALLGAERAFLFLVDDDGGPLALSAARNNEHGSLIGATNHASAVVERVRGTRQAVVVTGTDEAAALGSESAVQHGLRSILAAPLLLEGRLLGVVYLDSRLAKGIFTPDDVEILSAISSHIAISLETARANQLELTIATEREQRGLAETLRDSMAVISGTLDPAMVLARTLEMAWKIIRFDRAAVLMTGPGGEWTLAATAGDIDEALVAEQGLSAATDPFVQSLTVESGATVAGEILGGDGPLPELLGRAGSWLGVPLIARGELSGVLLMAADEPGELGQAQLELAATFAGQGIIAYENASLFKAVEHMATTDELTQTNNRRHFFALGEAQFATAKRYDLPFATLMLDIDHFKRVNDTFGHAAGDDVIRGVAERLQKVIRTVDILGRYGGEEFAFVLPCTGEAATVLAERIRTEISATRIPTVEGDLPVTVSVGVAVLAPQDANLAHTLNRADAALYAAKRAGRNRVQLAERDGAPDGAPH